MKNIVIFPIIVFGLIALTIPLFIATNMTDNFVKTECTFLNKQFWINKDTGINESMNVQINEKYVKLGCNEKFGIINEVRLDYD